MKIGENLKKLRKQANLTQQEVSEMLGFKNHTGYAHWGLSGTNQGRL